jgi:hypothetical protein
MLSTTFNTQQYNRIVDNRYGVLGAVSALKDQEGTSIVIAVDLATGSNVVIKLMASTNPELAHEFAVSELLPAGEVRFVKALDFVQAYFGMPAFPLFGDNSTLLSYNYMVMPFI